jgi:hypothetical protein
MQKIGEQYPKDDKLDPSGFLKRARRHQSLYRAHILELSYDGYGNYLTKEDAESGYNFYSDFGIFEAVKLRYPRYSKPLYSNMLRSEHIPFNFFIPFKYDYQFCKKVFNAFIPDKIQSIDCIEIEYAPKPKGNYLDDATSFDVYIEYSTNDSQKGIIGIEVKYTEREYGLVKESTQENTINDKTSKYYTVSEQCGIYKSESINVLPTDKFRQIWRNQLLGESILLVDKEKFNHFASVTIFPEGNIHFVETSKEYIDLLSENNQKFLAISYEEFFSVCKEYCPNEKYLDWINYLLARYIVTYAE